MVSTQKDGWDGFLSEHLRFCVDGMTKEPMLIRIVLKALRMSKHPRQQSSDGIDHNESR